VLNLKASVTDSCFSRHGMHPAAEPLRVDNGCSIVEIHVKSDVWE